MINQFMLIGRLVNNVTKEDNNITLAVSRNYKNENGEYETDFVDIVIRGSIINSTAEYCKKGDIIGVKGIIQNENINGVRKIILVAERVTFLSSKKADE